MIFAEARGMSGDGAFTSGKIYLARPAMESGDAANLDLLLIPDDNGIDIQEKVEDGRFSYRQSVFAVNLEPFEEEEPGHIWSVTDASKNGKDMLRIQGFGWHAASGFSIVDSDILFPGVYLHREDDRWYKVCAITGSWDVAYGLVDDVDPRGISSDPSPLTNFRFFVSDGDVCVEPMIKCIDPSDLDFELEFRIDLDINSKGPSRLTKDKMYMMTESNSKYVKVICDIGLEYMYQKERFEM